MHTDITVPFHLTLSDDPIDNNFSIKVNIKCNHKTLGLETELDTTMNRIKLLAYTPGTPAAKTGPSIPSDEEQTRARNVMG